LQEFIESELSLPNQNYARLQRRIAYTRVLRRLVPVVKKLLEVQATVRGVVLKPESVPERERNLERALAESLKLQAQYADLLNMHDGGQRRSFDTVDEWLTRLREKGTLKC